MKESFVFYKSFYESIKEVDDNIQLELFKAICEYSLNNEEIELTPISRALFTLMKPIIDSATKRYVASVENGKKGGAPKGNQNAKKQPKNNLKQPNNNLTKTKEQPKNNLNDNVNDNDNDNIYNYISENFGITINGTNLLKLQKWEEIFTNDILKYGVDLCVKNGVRTFSYLLAIYNNWKSCNYTTLKEIQKKEKREPEWFDNKIDKKEIDEKAKKELEDFLNQF